MRVIILYHSKMVVISYNVINYMAIIFYQLCDKKINIKKL